MSGEAVWKQWWGENKTMSNQNEREYSALAVRVKELEAERQALANRDPMLALGFAYAWACTLLDHGKDPRVVEVSTLVDAWNQAQPLFKKRIEEHAPHGVVIDGYTKYVVPPQTAEVKTGGGDQQ